jgi:hypothetical protein
MSLWLLAGSAHGLYAVLLHDGNAGWQLTIPRCFAGSNALRLSWISGVDR